MNSDPDNTGEPEYDDNSADPNQRGGQPGFKSAQQRKQLESYKNILKRQLSETQREEFKKRIEQEKIGQQFLDKQTLERIHEDVLKTVKP
ncbi:MAG: hypothetical protein K8T25_16870 [Planctomycetia bacterium]|nr:hypothetical protein [Planctomycetia bacterium]